MALEEILCHPRKSYIKAEAAGFLGESRNKVKHLVRMGILYCQDGKIPGSAIYSRLRTKGPDSKSFSLGYYSCHDDFYNESKLQKAIEAEGLAGRVQQVDSLNCTSHAFQQYLLLLLTLSHKQDWVVASTIYNSSKEEVANIHLRNALPTLFSPSQSADLLNALAINNVIASRKDGDKPRQYRI